MVSSIENLALAMYERDGDKYLYPAIAVGDRLHIALRDDLSEYLPKEEPCQTD